MDGSSLNGYCLGLQMVDLVDRGERTMVQNSLILGHKIIHFPTSLGVSEISEPANE